MFGWLFILKSLNAITVYNGSYMRYICCLLTEWFYCCYRKKRLVHIQHMYNSVIHLLSISCFKPLACHTAVILLVKYHIWFCLFHLIPLECSGWVSANVGSLTKIQRFSSMTCSQLKWENIQRPSFGYGGCWLVCSRTYCMYREGVRIVEFLRHATKYDY